MKHYVLWVWLLAIAGCATHPTPEPTNRPAPPRSPVADHVSPARIITGSLPRIEVPATSENDVVKAEPPSPEPARPAHLSAQALAAINERRLLDVYVGMTKERVARTMRTPDTGDWKNPYRTERLAVSDAEIYEIYYYLTREPPKGRPVTHNLLTPVIIKDDKVAAIGRYRLKKLRRAACTVRPGEPSCPQHSAF